MNKVALIIIYNHQFNKNIALLEQLYKDRFSTIYHLVPFYNGDQKNVIPVYECSYFFQGYVAQGLKSYFKEEYTHYFFIADDLILNPVINEKNYAEHLKLNSNTCFIPGFINLHDTKEWWSRVAEAFRWNIKIPGIEVNHQLPEYEKALQRFHQFDLTLKPLRFNQIWKTPNSIKSFRKMFVNDRHNFFRYLKNIITKRHYSLPYPIVGSYSDIFVVSANSIKEFCHYCGVFAATKLFVENALPTAMVLSADQIVTEKDLALQGKALWTNEEHEELNIYNNSLQELVTKFPSNYMYLHPIKLSKWNTEL